MEFEQFSDIGESNPMEGFAEAKKQSEEQEELGTVKDLLGLEEDQLTEDDQKLLDKYKDKLEDIRKELESDDDPGSSGSDEPGGTGDEDLGVVQLFAQTEGFLEEEELADFADDEEGLQSMIKARDGKRDKEVLASFLKAEPEVAAFYNHVVVNKLPAESYMQRLSKPAILSTEINSIPSDASDDTRQGIIDTHVSVIRAGLKGKVTDAVLEGIIDTAVEKGETEAMAKESLKTLTGEYESRVQQIDDQAKAQLDNMQKARDAAIKQINDTVKAGVLADEVLIPEAEKAAFIDFLTKPIDGVTKVTKQEQVLDSLNAQQDLLLDYILFKFSQTGKFNLTDLKKKSTNVRRFKTGKKNNDGRRQRDTGGQPRGKKGEVTGLPTNFMDVEIKQ